MAGLWGGFAASSALFLHCWPAVMAGLWPSPTIEQSSPGLTASRRPALPQVNDIVRGTFKGFAMLRQIALSSSQPGMPGFGQPQPVYVQGYGFVPPSQVGGSCSCGGRGGLLAVCLLRCVAFPCSLGRGSACQFAPQPQHHLSTPSLALLQVYNPEDPLAAATMLRSSPPTGPLTPPMTPLRGPGAAGPGGLTPEALAALLGQQQAGMAGMPGMGAPQASQGELHSCCCCTTVLALPCSIAAACLGCPGSPAPAQLPCPRLIRPSHSPLTIPNPTLQTPCWASCWAS